MTSKTDEWIHVPESDTHIEHIIIEQGDGYKKTVNNLVGATFAHNTSLASKSAARQDTERLDWLEANFADVTQSAITGEKSVFTEHCVGDGSNLREAIDAARCGLDEGEQKKDLGEKEA